MNEVLINAYPFFVKLVSPGLESDRQPSQSPFAMLFTWFIFAAAATFAGVLADADPEPQYYAQAPGHPSPVVGFTVETQDQYPYVSLRRAKQQEQPFQQQPYQQQYQPQPHPYQQPQPAVYTAAPGPAPGFGPRGQPPSSRYNEYEQSNLVAPPMPLPFPRPQQNFRAGAYPLTPPSLKFRIGVISDQDKASKGADGKFWHALLKEGYLDLAEDRSNPGASKLRIGWEDEKDYVHNIKSGLAYSGRGMELSTLNAFHGKLYSCDDKTGVVYQLQMEPQGEEQQQHSSEDEKAKSNTDITPIPWAILADGGFEGPNGFKCEWGTIKDDELWIGGHGVHKYNESGAIVSSKDRFIKKISPTGEVQHLDWSENFDKMAAALDVHNPGYVTHEAAGWSDVLQKWIFTPRKVSKEQFDDARDAQSGSNVMLIADAEFNDIEVVHIGSPTPTEGFSGFKFVPGTSDQYIIALKTEEAEDHVKSFILAFDLKGNVLLNETEFANVKYEALEFL